MKTSSFPPTNEHLLRRMRDPGEHTAWKDFYDLYWRVILSYARSRGLGDREAAEVLQETMLVLMQAMPTFEYDPSRGRFRSFLLNIVHRKVQEHKHRQLREAAMLEGQTVPDLPDESATGARRIEAEEDAALENAICEEALIRTRKRVEPDNFTAFRLLSGEGRPIEEVSKEMAKTANALYQIQHRCRKIYSEELESLRSALRQ
jgi:RNA polymerase sigma factor (sigma-70 family)